MYFCQLFFNLIFMIDYTPDHQYTEVKDSSSTEEKGCTSEITIFIVIFTSLFGLAIYHLPNWWILFTIIFVPVILVALLIGAISSYKEPSKNEIANAIKRVIGFDFGDDFKLLKADSHDYEEYLYIFPEESFENFKLYLESIDENTIKEFELNNRIIHRNENGFTLSENRLEDGVCGNIETIIIDYNERTLKHKFVIY